MHLHPDPAGNPVLQSGELAMPAAIALRLGGKPAGLKDWVARRIGQKPDLTAAELAAEIAATHGMQVHRGSVWRLLRDLGLTHKKRPASRRAEAA